VCLSGRGSWLPTWRQTYLNTFGLDPKHAGRDAAALGAIFVCLAVASYAALALGSRARSGGGLFRRPGSGGRSK
jgi:hypothetical protein